MEEGALDTDDKRKNEFSDGMSISGEACKNAVAPGMVTLLLKRISAGDTDAEQQLFEAVYDDLRRVAGAFFRRERATHILQATALVHETYLRLAGDVQLDWQSRAHFFAVAASVMRRVLVDYARSRGALRRGGNAQRVEISESFILTEDNPDSTILIDDALNRLAEIDARQAQVAEMRYFAGLTEEEIAIILDVSERTVKRCWKSAKSWLRSHLQS